MEPRNRNMLLQSYVINGSSPENVQMRFRIPFTMCRCSFVDHPRSCHQNRKFTPPKTNMEPENEPLEEEIPIKNHHF